jgi:hypothetical protein
VPPDMPIRSHAEQTLVEADLLRAGVALIDGVAGPLDLLGLARSLGSVVRHRDSRPDGVTTIEDRGAARVAGLAGFTRCTLPPHTDGSGVNEPPGLLLTACGREPLEGGQITLVDGRAVYGELASIATEAIDALHTARSAMFGGADGHLGSVFTRRADGAITIRLRLDILARFAPVVTPHLPALREAIRRHTLSLSATKGTGYVLDNHRWLHGRLAYEGPRVMYRVLAQPDPGRIPTGFHAAVERGLSAASIQDELPA